MDIYQEIIDTLKREYAAGATYQEMAAKHNVSYQYIRELLVGDKPVGRMSLEFFFRLFPRATINLHGDTVTMKNNTGAAVTGVNRGTINVGDPITPDVIEWRSGVVEEILLDDDLTDEEKVKFLKILKPGKEK